MKGKDTETVKRIPVKIRIQSFKKAVLRKVKILYPESRENGCIPKRNGKVLPRKETGKERYGDCIPKRNSVKIRRQPFRDKPLTKKASLLSHCKTSHCKTSHCKKG